MTGLALGTLDGGLLGRVHWTVKVLGAAQPECTCSAWCACCLCRAHLGWLWPRAPRGALQEWAWFGPPQWLGFGGEPKAAWERSNHQDSDVATGSLVLLVFFQKPLVCKKYTLNNSILKGFCKVSGLEFKPCALYFLSSSQLSTVMPGF